MKQFAAGLILGAVLASIAWWNAGYRSPISAVVEHAIQKQTTGMLNRMVQSNVDMHVSLTVDRPDCEEFVKSYQAVRSEPTMETAGPMLNAIRAEAKRKGCAK